MTTATKKRATPKPRTQVVLIEAREGESHPQAFARHSLGPEYQAGATLTMLNGTHPEADIMAFADELRRQWEAASSGNLERGEAMLTAQAHTLDALFHALAERARRNRGEYLGASETIMRLAFKAQSQCRSTWEAIAEIKNPRQVSFVRQANVGQNVQVNNGAMDRAREIESPRAKLLEANDGERLDARAASTPGRTDQKLETVGAIDRTANSPGQGEG